MGTHMVVMIWSCYSGYSHGVMLWSCYGHVIAGTHMASCYGHVIAGTHMAVMASFWNVTKAMPRGLVLTFSFSFLYSSFSLDSLLV